MYLPSRIEQSENNAIISKKQGMRLGVGCSGEEVYI
jgi:hypothetical protein